MNLDKLNLYCIRMYVEYEENLIDLWPHIY